jgi:hypothetical protein
MTLPLHYSHDYAALILAQLRAEYPHASGYILACAAKVRASETPRTRPALRIVQGGRA